MGIGALTLVSPGSVTAPSSLTATVSSALTAVFRDYGLSDTILLPGLKAILFCNGIDFQYHALDGAQYLTGPLAPGTAPTTASTATRATVVLTLTVAVANGDTVTLDYVVPVSGMVQSATNLVAAAALSTEAVTNNVP